MQLHNQVHRTRQLVPAALSEAIVQIAREVKRLPKVTIHAGGTSQPFGTPKVAFPFEPPTSVDITGPALFQARCPHSAALLDFAPVRRFLLLSE